MRYLLTLVVLLISLSISAQHIQPCSESKIRNSNPSLSKKRYNEKDKLLMSQYDVTYYDINLDIERNTDYIEGYTGIGAVNISASLDTFTFELSPTLQIDSIVYNHSQLVFDREGSMVHTKFNSALAFNEKIFMKIYYHGNTSSPVDSLHGLIHVSSTMFFNDGLTYSHSEPFASFRWFPCKQFLQDKADSASISILTDSTNKVASNGKLVSIENTSTNKVIYHWKTKHPIAYYLISVAVSNYNLKSKKLNLKNIPFDSLQLDLFYPPQFATGPYFTFNDSIENYLRVFSKLLGKYPFKDEKYGHCLTDLSGGMENQTISNIGTSTFYPGIITHELAHQWFGDYVTCRTWNDIYLNEGLATFMTMYYYPDSTAIAQMNYSVISNASNGSVYCPDTIDRERIFSEPLTYNKGALVTRTLQYIIGDSLLFASLRNYISEYANKNASLLDFQHILENTSGRNLDTFFNQWIYGEGYPIYKVYYNVIDSQLIVQVNQTTSAPIITPFFFTPIDIRIYKNMVDTTIRIYNSFPGQKFTIPWKFSTANIRVDPYNWVIHKSGNTAYKDTTLTAPHIIPTDTVVIEKPMVVYPNPASTFLSIDHVKGSNSNAILTDLTGRKVEMFKLNEGSNKLDISTLPCGVYYLKVYQNKISTWKEKIVICR